MKDPFIEMIANIYKEDDRKQVEKLKTNLSIRS